MTISDTAPAPKIDPLFTALSPEELLELRHRMASGGHKFFEVGHALAGVAFTLPVFSDERSMLFTQRQRWVDAMHETFATVGYGHA